MRAGFSATEYRERNPDLVQSSQPITTVDPREMNGTLTLVSILAFLIAQNGAYADDLKSSKRNADPSVVAKLFETGSVRCEPALRYFCANIHVACAGRTTKRAFSFVMRVKAKRGWIEPAGQSAIDQYFSTTMLITNAGRTHVILPLPSDRGYVKLESDGKYSFRYYNRGSGVMSYGKCR